MAKSVDRERKRQHGKKMTVRNYLLLFYSLYIPKMKKERRKAMKIIHTLKRSANATEK